MGWASKTRKRLNSISVTEKILEDFLKKERIGFSRNRCVQVAGGNYRFIDFSLRKHKLLVEIDGPEHSKEKDDFRHDDLMTIRSLRKYKILRFKNEDILERLSWVKDEILKLTERRV